MDGLYDCPGCGKKQSAWGDGMCGQCEARYHKERQRLEDLERAEEAYLREWGLILYMVSEIGYGNYFSQAEGIYNRRKEVTANRRRQSKAEQANVLKALDEAIAQHEANGKIDAPKESHRYAWYE